MLLIRQQDKPGLIASVSTILGREGINISFMTVARSGPGGDAFMAIGVDSRPRSAVRCCSETLCMLQGYEKQCTRATSMHMQCMHVYCMSTASRDWQDLFKRPFVEPDGAL